MPLPPNIAALRLRTEAFFLFGGLLTACLGFLATPSSYAQPIDTWAEMGRSPIRYIDPSAYNASKENWSIVKDNAGLLYVANGSGILIHDGVNWELLPTQSDFIRPLAHTDDDIIYYGGNNEFGYVATDAQGRRQLVSLVAHVPEAERNFLQVWNIALYDSAVFFQADNHLFRWKNDTMTVWNTEGYLRDIGVVGDQFIVYQEDQFLRLSDTDTLEAIPTDAQLIGGIEEFIADGPEHVLLLGNDTLLRCRIAMDVQNTCMDATPELAAAGTPFPPYSIARLPDSSIAVGYDGQGLALLSPAGKLKRLIGTSEGLENLEVMGLHATEQGVLWLALYDGIARMEPDGYLTSFTKAEGLSSRVNDIVRWNDTIWASTMLGLYQLIPGNQGAAAQFVRVRESEPHLNCFDMVESGDQLLVGCRYGIVRIEMDEDGRGKAVTVVGEELEIEALAIDPATPDLLYVGLKGRLTVLHVKEEAIDIVYSLPVDGIVNAIGIKPRAHPAEPTELWANASGGAIHRLIKSGSDTSWEHTRYATINGLQDDVYTFFWFNGEMGMVTSEGVHTISGTDDGSLTATPYAPITQSGHSDEFLGFDSDSTAWFFADHRIWRITPQGNGEVAVDSIAPHPLLSTLLEPTMMFVDADRSLWMAHGRGIVHLQYEALARDHPKPRLHIATARSLVADTTFYPTGAPPEQTVVIPHALASLRFDFAAQVYDFPERVQYRVWLEGLDGAWQPWSSETSKEFTNLKAGLHTLHVKARDAYDQESETVSFAFLVSPPWYRTRWAYALWTLATALLIGGITMAYGQVHNRWLKARNRVLERTVAERTREIQQQKEAVERVNDELLQVNHSLSERTNQLREALEVNKDILGITAHDLKNPLGGVIGLAEVVIMNAEEEPEAPVNSATEFVSIIRDAAERMLKIVQELLDTHRQGNDSFLTLEPASLSEIVTRAIQWNNRQAQQKNIRIHFADSAPSDVACDVVAIQRAVDNYLSNAVKYSPAGSNIWVSLSPEHTHAAPMVCLKVRDEGPGLTEEDMTRVFGKMTRLSAQPTAGEHSTGLGLYIVKQLVEAHGGTVGVESTVGEGATFWLTLPLLVTSEASEAVSSNP